MSNRQFLRTVSVEQNKLPINFEFPPTRREHNPPLEIRQVNGQMIWGGEVAWPPGTLKPGPNTEVYMGGLPREWTMEQFVRILLQFPQLYQFRLCMNFSGTNRGFGFAQFFTKEAAMSAQRGLDKFCIAPGWYLHAKMSLNNKILEIVYEDKKENLGIVKEMVKRECLHPDVDCALQGTKFRKRGYNVQFRAYVQYKSHSGTMAARRRLLCEIGERREITMEWCRQSVIALQNRLEIGNSWIREYLRKEILGSREKFIHREVDIKILPLLHALKMGFSEFSDLDELLKFVQVSVLKVPSYIEN